VGFSGADGNLIHDKRNHPTINYGFVGDVKKVNTQLLNLSTGIVLYFVL
jgi:acetylglutamate kinase